jgi:hypothetical protein
VRTHQTQSSVGITSVHRDGRGCAPDAWAVSWRTFSTDSGPGRLFGGCSSSVSRQAFVVDREWLRSGRRLWKPANCDFKRDFWVPRHTVDFSSCVRVPASCSEISRLSKQLFMRLRVSVHAGHSWAPESEPLFEDKHIASAFTEHSVQCFRMSLSAWAGVDRGRRAYLGR